MIDHFSSLSAIVGSGMVASAQATFAGLLAAFFVVGWVVFLVVQVRRGDAQLGDEVLDAPNRKAYFDDEGLEGPRLERFLSVAFASLIVVALGMALYWLREPGRQAGALQGFKQRSIRRGERLFAATGGEFPEALGCANCHGNSGQGGVASFSITDPATGLPRLVKWQAPPVNVAFLRYTDPEQKTDRVKKVEKLRSVLTYGRPNTPMPAWGVEGGGVLNTQGIDDLVSYLESISLTPDQAKAQALGSVDWPDGTKVYANYDGEKLFNSYCARCHTKGWSYGEPDVAGGGAFGPNLRNGSVVRQFPVEKEQVDFVQTGTKNNVAYGVRGIGHIAAGGMPGFAQTLNPAQIQAIVTYEREQLGE